MKYRLRLARFVCRRIPFLYPSSFRAQFGPAIVDALDRELQRLSTVASSPVDWLSFWRMLVLDCGRTVPRAWLDALRRQPTGAASVPSFVPAGSGLLPVVWRDLRFAGRSVWRAWPASLLMIGAIGTGIGVTTGVVTTARSVVFDALPYPDADRLYMMTESTGHGISFLAYSSFVAQEQPWEIAGFTLTRRGATHFNGEFAESVDGTFATANLASVVGIAPIRGRWFTPAENQVNGGHVLVVSEAFWKNHLGGDASAIGSHVVLDDTSHTVIGVMPDRFAFPNSSVQFWRPLQGSITDDARVLGPISTVVRLGSGVDATIAADALNRIGRALRLNDRRSGAPVEFRLVSRLEYVFGNLPQRMLVLLGACALGLIVVGANTSTMMLSRASARSAQTVVRRALGASRAAVARLTVFESLLASLVGGAVAIPIAWMTTHFIATRVDLMPRLSADLGGGTIGIALACSLFMGIACGVLPAVFQARIDTGRASGSLGIGPRGANAQRALVTLQIATAFALAIAASAIVRTFAQMVATDPGFRTENITAIRFELPREPYRYSEPRLGFFRDLQSRMRSLPGVNEVTLASHVLTRVDEQGRDFVIEGHAIDAGGEYNASGIGVGIGYFGMLDIHVTAGRAFRTTDDPDAEPVVVINDAAATRYWSGTDPLGTRIRLGSVRSRDPWLRVVGVVTNTDRHGPGRAYVPEIYFPYEQNVEFRSSRMYVLASTSRETNLAAETIRRTVAEIDPLVPVREIMSLESAYDEFFVEPRTVTYLLSGSALLAIALSVFGVYATMMLVVVSRQADLGVRIALGASTVRIAWGVLRDASRMVLIGLIVGTVVAGVLARAVTVLVVNTRAFEPVTLLLVSAGFVMAVVGAVLGPALFAVRVDPMRVIRTEV